MTSKVNPAPLWLIICLFGLSHTSETVIAIALPYLAKSFSITDNLAQISSAIYYSGFAIGILSWGRICDNIGRRLVMLIGLSMYIVCTFSCSFAGSIYTLFFIRFFQAFGISVASVACQAMTRDSFQGQRLAYAFSMISLGMSMVPSIGPLVGGYIVEYMGWKYNFRTLGIVAIFMFIICLIKLPETHDISTPKVKYWPTVIKVFSDKSVLMYGLITGFFNGIMFGFYMSLPFMFENLGFSPSQYGKAGIILSLSMLVGSFLNRALIKKYIDSNKIILSGMRLSIAGLSILLLFAFLNIEKLVPAYISATIITVCMVIQLIGHTLVVPICLKMALENYSKVTGTAGSIYGSIYYSIVSIVNFTISRIHSDKILSIAILFFALSVISFIIFSIFYKNLRTGKTSRAI